MIVKANDDLRQEVLAM